MFAAPMASPLALPAEARRILELARRDRGAARSALAALPLDQQVELVCRTPVARRGELLDLAPEPEALVPALPEAELCFTLKAVGLSESAWLLEHATPEQLTTCVDLDAWKGDAPDRGALAAWLEAFAEAGEDTLLRAARSLDPELLVLELTQRAEVFAKPGGDDDWQPPDGAQTLEGVFWLRSRGDGDDLAALMELLEVLFREDYWFYFRLMQGAIWEVESETELWAERWREGRLQDLGFPPLDEALPIYAHLPRERLDALPEEARALDVEAWRLPVFAPQLPLVPDARQLVFRAGAELGAEERAAFLYALLGLANKVAVSQRMRLSDAASMPAAIERAAELASAGLAYLAERHARSAVELLRRVRLEHLFRVGANLRGERPAPPPA
jgi:hypothetical protein